MFHRIASGVPSPSPVSVGVRRSLALGAMVCTLSLPIAAAAAADADGLDEIVVTASKRATNLQQTPISITALTGDVLQERGLTSLTDVVHQTPGVSFKTNGGPGQTEIQIRGMTSTGGESPTVGFYLDEIPLTPAAQSNNGKVVLDPNLFDLQRVEVLRGPQGTLYGAGSMGGTIRLIASKPDLRNTIVNAQAIVSNTDGGGFNRSENGAINLPIVEDKVALRVVVSDTKNSGWIDRVVLNPFPLPTRPDLECGFYGCVRGNVLAAPVQKRHEGVNDLQTTAARATLLIQATDRLTIEPMFLHQHQSSRGISTFDTVPGTLAHYQPLDQAEPLSDNFNLYAATVKYHFDAVDVTSVTAKWDRRQRTNQDDAEIFQMFFGTPAYAVASGGLGVSPAMEADTVSQFSQELRVSSNRDGPFKALVGAFYSDYDSTLDFFAGAPAAVAILGQDTVAFQDQPTTIKQKALFGEVSYKFKAPVEVTLGLRRFEYDSSLGVLAYGAAFGNDVANPTRSFTKTSDSGFNPKFNVSWTVGDHDMLYVTAAKGFRPGAANSPVPVAPCAADLAAFGRTSGPTGFDADKVWSYELGNKFSTEDRRVVLNTGVYHEHWTGIQQQVPLSCGFVYTDNLGVADIYGAELELAARLTPSVTFTLNGAYMDATLSKDVPAAGVEKGTRLQNIPKITAGAAIEYARPVSENYKFITRVSDDYIGDRADAYSPLPGYNVMDARIGLSGNPWTVHLYAKNVLNRVVNISNTIALTAQIPLYYRAVSNQPATIGIDASYRF